MAKDKRHRLIARILQMKDLKGDNTPAAKRRSKLAITIANLEEKIKTHMQKTTKMRANGTDSSSLKWWSCGMSWEEIDSAIHRSSKFRRDLLPQEALGVLVDSIKLSQEVKWELKEANARP
ncbi:uncharacterized protein PADG_11595 [Paracoccidioides brasiliensis Pb18]|uniref:Uncharacterized protein n=1 Tax=Paracoccidioides brasiliensis (strain Pb18) TaxID=502780 RepID=A0A0A0HT64_PARBD|nr:uncharacterized protein PADG_11595 [Paracoccidioides brasiliensis Pb18]KGM92394.1 hypothetical protein PADG_11595 [Paracoccidioides brasiliensis Pb18]